MDVFLYEHLTGGGLLREHVAQGLSALRVEGHAMVQAFAADLNRVPGVTVRGLWDTHQETPPPLGWLGVASAAAHAAGFAQLASGSDATLLIAPETGGVLRELCHQVESGGGTLFGPAAETVRLCADKHFTAEWLLAHGLPAPRGIHLAPGQHLPLGFPAPAILKPRDGCGSQGVRWWDGNTPLVAEAPSRLERFCPGLAVSVAVLCGPAGCTPLIPCRQLLGGTELFEYLGGTLPLDAALAERALSLACLAAATLPDCRGYLGFDLVLGPDPQGSEDFVIEINPRLTTSYVGLRAAYASNLAAAILAAAAGHPCELVPRPGTVRFSARGEVFREPITVDAGIAEADQFHPSLAQKPEVDCFPPWDI